MSELLVVQNGHVGKRPVGQVSARELAENYNIVDSGHGYGIASPVQLAEKAEPKPKLDQQISARGATAFGTGLKVDYNPQFIFPENINTYREVRMDAQVRSALRVYKSPVLAARWFMRPASNKPIDRARAKWMWKAITEWMTVTWPQILVESLYMVDYGFYIFEKVFTKGPDGLIRWKRWSPIHPLEVVEPEYDESDGGYKGIKVLVEKGGNAVEQTIPIESLLIFTYDKESGGFEGTSGLRSVYKHWFIKENLLKIDAIQKERHAIGIPIIILPMNYDRGDPANGIASPDVTAAHQIGTNLRGNESAHVVLPPLWDIKFAKLEGNNVDPIKSAEYHGRMIYENFLVNFMDSNPSTSHVGGHDETFMKGTRFLADIVRDVINRYAIPQIYNWNWGEPEEVIDTMTGKEEEPDEMVSDGYPQVGVRRLGDTTDWRTISFAARNLVGAKIIKPDDKLEEHFREEMDFPDADPETVRESEDPTRQTPPSSTPPKGNAGTDKSGGQ